MGTLHIARKRRRSQAGFTLMEVLIALLVFAISVVGLVALEARGIEAQRAASEMRDAERLAQETMADLQSRGFIELVTFDFVLTPDPPLPYDDTAILPATRMRHYHRPPADIPDSTDVIGSVRNSYIVSRRVDWIFDAANPPAPGEWEKVTALEFEVTVLWLDYSNPSYPPPESATVTGLTTNMIDPADAAYAPYVGHVQLRTVRANDAFVP